MARKSRKTRQVAETSPPAYNTSLYARLSADSGKGDSIENQEGLLSKYIEEHSELTLKKIFVDNGETGVNFERPAWNALMQECRQGNINCIVVKDLSRLGRNFIETGDYLERILPTLGVRLIAVNDSYDSLNISAGGRLVSGLKNLINDIYAKDISRKVCAVMHTKQKNGEFVGATACYGYLKDKHDKKKLVVNPETAPVVQQIFQWKSEGIGNGAICKMLNAQNVPSPYKYKYINGIMKNPKFNSSIWIPETVSKLLRNTMYLGHMSQGKKKEALFEGKPLRDIKRENWIIVENTHEPIISREMFEKVEAVLAERAAQYNADYGKNEHLKTTAYILQGLIFCAECGKALKRLNSINREKGQIRWFYECRFYKNLKSCAKKSIKETALYLAVYEAIKGQLKTYLPAVIESLNEIGGVISSCDIKIQKLTGELQRIDLLRNALFEKYSEKLLTTSEFKFANEKYIADEANVQKQLETMQTMKHKNKCPANFKRLLNDEISREMAQALIERIDVHEGRRAEVTFKFRDEFLQTHKRTNVCEL
ncbi:MAG: recombinase family protein [Defluviitaleaceae bacterium]|nr:recombinase family protein [Defluviitaleaceae bacterium]